MTPDPHYRHYSHYRHYTALCSTMEWAQGLLMFPPFTVPSPTKGSGSASSNGLDDGGGSSKLTGPASPTQSGHPNAAAQVTLEFKPKRYIYSQATSGQKGTRKQDGSDAGNI
ncbi:hypothetical protein B0H13DRAFT_1853909 [Mycena leptocephala]|nr:hypothetical protein B0H13DRAFT_1853909 [Mycena leptocephala]